MSERQRTIDATEEIRLTVFAGDIDEVRITVDGGSIPAEVGAEFTCRVTAIVRRVTER